MTSHDRRVLRLALLASAPATLAAAGLLWIGHFPPRVQWTFGIFLVVWGLLAAAALREQVVRPWQTMSNLLAALREGDFSLRARGANADDALELAFLEANTLGDTLRAHRLGALEATALLRTVMAEIDVAVFTFDAERRLTLVNRAGERLLGRAAERLLGRTAEELSLAACLEGESPRILEAVLPRAIGRWEVRRNTFREAGTIHHLLVLSDLSLTLQAEERLAWQRLIRVLSHEINNSLAPIKSIAGSLRGILSRTPRPADADQDLREGLDVIAGRSESLGRFMTAYARLARLPRPVLKPLDVPLWVQRVVGLETRMPVEVRCGPAVVIQADPDQLEQLLINLVANAVDAVQETGGAVSLTWSAEPEWVTVTVEDEGPGLLDATNLFVPFYTTKPGGTGIGLVLSRQIAESHGGTLVLENRRDRRGCRASLRLPRG